MLPPDVAGRKPNGKPPGHAAFVNPAHTPRDPAALGRTRLSRNHSSHRGSGNSRDQRSSVAFGCAKLEFP
jgi:hypothetical protein